MVTVPGPRLSLAFLIAGMGFLMLPLADALGKMMGAEGLSPLQIGWGRWVAHAAIMTPLVLILYGRAALRPKQFWGQVIRALLLVTATMFFFTGLLTIPLPTMTATLFVAPLLVTALSGLVLKERVGIWRWSGVVVGFLGMLLIVRPGADSFQTGSLYALATAACFAGSLLETRKIAGQNPPMVTMMWMGFIGVLVMSVVVIPVYQPFTPRQWGMIGIMGAILTLGHGLIVWAADRLEASAMAPMPYLEMVTSTIVGYYVFQDFPTLTTWIGCGMVTASGIFIAWRENRLNKQIDPAEQNLL